MIRINIGVKGGYRPNEFTGSLNKETLNKFKKWANNTHGHYAGVEVAGRVGARVFAVSNILYGISSKNFQRKAALLLERRISDAYRQKFETHGFGRWRNIKYSTFAKRESLAKHGAVLDSGANADTPLWFTGSMKRAMMNNVKIKTFDFFNKKSFDKGKLVIKGFKLQTMFKRGGEENAPNWYWKGSSLNTWTRLIQHQERKKWQIGLNKKEFYEHAWSIFLKKDLAALFSKEAEIASSAVTSGKTASPEIRNAITGMIKGYLNVLYKDSDFAAMPAFKKAVTEVLGKPAVVEYVMKKQHDTRQSAFDIIDDIVDAVYKRLQQQDIIDEFGEEESGE